VRPCPARPPVIADRSPSANLVSRIDAWRPVALGSAEVRQDPSHCQGRSAIHLKAPSGGMLERGPCW
jgi:hypothetical protein